MEKLNEAILELVNSKIMLDDFTEVRSGVFWGDEIWDFSGENTVRNNSIPVARMRFNWKDISERLGVHITQDLKILTYFMIVAPSLFGIKGDYKITTLQMRIMKICGVIEEVLRQKQMELSFMQSIDVLCIGDLQLNDFKEIRLHETRINDVKVILRALANTYIQKYFIQSVNWNINDIKTLNFVTLPKEKAKEVAATPLAEKFYLEIIKQVTVDIVGFKKAMNMPIQATITSPMSEQIKMLEYNFEQAFNMYRSILEKDCISSVKSGKRMNYSSQIRKKFSNRFAMPVKDFNEIIRDIHAAAILAILLFTGVRYSEVITMKRGCLHKRNDIYAMKGTVVKHRNERLPTDIDEWVAIPIVRDAIEILELFQVLTNNSYLVAPLRGVYLSQKDIPLSDNGLTKLLNNYAVKKAATNKTLKIFTNDMQQNKITSHRLRHSLAQQLVRGKLGLPYISYHFKHVNSAVVAYNRVSNVTLGYGGISREIVNSAKSFQAAKKELFEQIYSPDAVVAGGGNAKEFMKRKTEYFQGLMVNDEEIENVIEDLKDQSLPFLDVGLGYCGGRKDLVLPDGTKQAPPCIGQLKCNPVDCGNAVIPKSKLPIWKKVHDDAVAKLNDDSFAYMEVELKEIVRRAEMVLNHFR